jgi:hypothetical protein
MFEFFAFMQPKLHSQYAPRSYLDPDPRLPDSGSSYRGLLVRAVTPYQKGN